MSEENKSTSEAEDLDLGVFKIIQVKWKSKRQRIPMRLRKSTLEAMDLLDKNAFPTRTDFIEKLVENYLIKRGYLQKNPNPKTSRKGAKSHKVVEWRDSKLQIDFYLRISTLEAIKNLDKNKFHNRTDFVERLIEHYLIKKGFLSPNPFSKKIKITKDA